MSHRKPVPNYRHPLIKKDANAYVLGENGFNILHTDATEVSRNRFRDHTYVVASDFQVYAEFPLYAVLTGEYHRLWLTKEQAERFRCYDIQRNHTEVDPRVFDLHKIGVIEPWIERRKARKLKAAEEGEDDSEIENPDQRAFIRAYTGPSCTVSVNVDKSGHYWLGSTPQHFRPYTAMVHGRPEVRFMFPHLEYLGPPEGVVEEGEDGAGFWFTDRWGRREDKRRLTLCTYEVSKVIEELGVWGHYFPLGDAMFDPEVARYEAAKLRKHYLWAVEKDRVEWKPKVDDLQQQLEHTENHNRTLGAQVRELTTERDKLKDAVGKLEAENELLKKQRPKARSFDPLWDGEPG